MLSPAGQSKRLSMNIPMGMNLMDKHREVYMKLIGFIDFPGITKKAQEYNKYWSIV